MTNYSQHCNVLAAKMTISEKNMTYGLRGHPQCLYYLGRKSSTPDIPSLQSHNAPRVRLKNTRSPRADLHSSVGFGGLVKYFNLENRGQTNLEKENTYIYIHTHTPIEKNLESKTKHTTISM